MHKKISQFNLTIKLVLFSIPFIFSKAICAQEAPAPTSQILAPSGLADKEQGRLEQQYKFLYRNKQLLLSPYSEGMSKDTLKLDASQIPAGEAQSYYYFNIAMDLYKDGNLEEAQQILEYLCAQKPDDEYLRNYLDRVRKEERTRSEEWQKSVKRDAEFLKKQKIKRFLQEGITYYNNGSFDKALLSFYDTLTLAPDTEMAKYYIDKLKEHYLLKVRAERAANKTTALSSNATSEDVLDKAALDKLVLDKRAQKLLDKEELDQKLKDVVSSEFDKEQRATQLTIGPGDILKVTVDSHPEFSGELSIGADGALIIPLANELVPVKGLTLPELTTKLTSVFGKYIQNPTVIVTIKDYKSRLFFVIDESGAHPFPINRANFSLLDALFLADWGNDRALGRILVIKPSKTKPLVRKVDGFALVYRGDLSKNVRIDNGDVIYIPRTVMGKTASSITDFFSPAVAAKNATGGVLGTKQNIHDLKDWTLIGTQPLDH